MYSLSLDKMKEMMNELKKHMEFQSHLKEYMDSFPPQKRDALLKQLYEMMSLDAKLQIYNDLNNAKNINYVIFSYGNEHKLMNKKSLYTIYKKLSRYFLLSEFDIVYICDGEKHYYDCLLADNYSMSDESTDIKYLRHGDGDILSKQLWKQLYYYTGIVVRFVHPEAKLVTINTENFTKAVTECEQYNGLSMYLNKINYYKINMNDEIKTVLHLKYDTKPDQLI